MALEFSKFLMSLSPKEDPLGALFLIEFYAIRAKDYDWFIQFAMGFCKEFGINGSLLAQADVLFTFALAKAIKLIRAKVELKIVETKPFKNLTELSHLHPSIILTTAISRFPTLANAIMAVI